MKKLFFLVIKEVLKIDWALRIFGGLLENFRINTIKSTKVHHENYFADLNF